MTLTSRLAAAQAPSPEAPPPPGSLWVYVTLPAIGRGARLEAFEASPSSDPDEDESWKRVCYAPCGIWVPSSTRLRIEGDFRASRPFSLPLRPAVRLEVDPARSGIRITGIVLMPIGGFFALVGAVIATADGRNTGEIQNLGRGFAVFGLATFGAGLAMLLIHNQTTVDIVDPAARPSASRATFGVPRMALGKGLWLSQDGLRF